LDVALLSLALVVAAQAAAPPEAAGAAVDVPAAVPVDEVVLDWAAA
jgi:hypothetical protein